jgi:ribosomal protein L18
MIFFTKNNNHQQNTNRRINLKIKDSYYSKVHVLVVIKHLDYHQAQILKINHKLSINFAHNALRLIIKS